MRLVDMRSLATVVLLLAAVSASCSDQDSAAPDGAVVRDLLAEPDSRQQVVGDGWQVVLSVLVPEDRLPEPRLYVDGADVGDISIYEVREAVQSVDLIGDYAAVITFPGYGAGPGCVPVVVDQLGFAGDQLLSLIHI